MGSPRLRGPGLPLPPESKGHPYLDPGAPAPCARDCDGVTWITVADPEVKHLVVPTNGIKLHAVTAGDGPLVVLLHGFPESWHSWRHQIGELSRSFRVVAPDLRGYNESDRPAGIDAYHLDHVAADIAGLIEELGETTARVVGHDWGGATAWHLAQRHAARVNRLAILNAPHPAAFARELRTMRQILKSWYIFFFQLPFLPELALGAFGHVMLRRAVLDLAIRKDRITSADLDRIAALMAPPGALTAAVNYYRATLRHRPPAGAISQPIQAPTLVIWGEDDGALGKPLTEGLDRWVPSVRVSTIPRCGHWVHQEAPDAVNALLKEFLDA